MRIRTKIEGDIDARGLGTHGRRKMGVDRRPVCLDSSG